MKKRDVEVCGEGIVVSAVKSGASALILSDIVNLPWLRFGRRSVADAWCITVAVRLFFRAIDTYRRPQCDLRHRNSLPIAAVLFR